MQLLFNSLHNSARVVAGPHLYKMKALMQSKEAIEANAIKLRIAAIRLELATRKNVYFLDGIQRPMKERTALEVELAGLEFQRMSANLDAKNRLFQVKAKRAELLKQKLIELGLPSLLDECLAEAQAIIEAEQMETV